MRLLLREDELRIDIVRLKDLRMLNRYFLIVLVVNQQDGLVVGTNQERRCYALPTPRVLILQLAPCTLPHAAAWAEFVVAKAGVHRANDSEAGSAGAVLVLLFGTSHAGSLVRRAYQDIQLTSLRTR